MKKEMQEQQKKQKEEIRAQEKESRSQSLVVKVIKGVDLTAMDKTGFSDPFVRLEIGNTLLAQSIVVSQVRLS